MFFTFVGCCKNSFSALQLDKDHSSLLFLLMCIACLGCRAGEGIIHPFLAFPSSNLLVCK